MNNINLMSIPSENRLFCFVNYNAFAEMKDKHGCTHYADLELLKEPVIASSLDAAKEKLAKIFKVPVETMTQWEVIGEDNGFAPSLNIGFNTALMTAGFSFDVYTTVNTLALLED